MWDEYSQFSHHKQYYDFYDFYAEKQLLFILTWRNIFITVYVIISSLMANLIILNEHFLSSYKSYFI